MAVQTFGELTHVCYWGGGGGGVECNNESLFFWYGHFRPSAHIIYATRWNIHKRDDAERELSSLLRNKTLQHCKMEVGE
jgi:succinate dehydrogenase/fumarate reductase-like Fe-S protein